MDTKDTSAIKPGFFNNLPTFKEDRKPLAGDEEKHLYNLSNHAGWRILSDYTESLLRDLDQATDLALTQGLSLEEIGKNAVVVNMAKGIIKRILLKVSDARESVQETNAK